MSERDSLRRLVDVWPLLAAIGSGLVVATGMGYKINEHTRVLERHTRHIKQCESNALVARVNTDALVAKLLSPVERQRLDAEAKRLSTYVLEEKQEKED